jgi:hypothetical protein
MAEPQAKTQEKTARGIVARGRTVDIPTGKRTVVSHHPTTGEPVYRAVTRTAVPGEEIELPVSEIEYLRNGGFLVDTSKVIPALADGTHLSEMGGATSSTS